MLRLMTKQFSKWVVKQNIKNDELITTLGELQSGNFDANLGSNIYKKRIKINRQGKRSSGRTIICYKKEERAIFIHGFSKSEKSNLSIKEFIAFKELSTILFAFSVEELNIAIENGDLIEVIL